MVSDSSTDGFEKRKEEEEEESGGGGGVEELVWSLSTSRQLMKMDGEDTVSTLTLQTLTYDTAEHRGLALRRRRKNPEEEKALAGEYDLICAV